MCRSLPRLGLLLTIGLGLLSLSCAPSGIQHVPGNVEFEALDQPLDLEQIEALGRELFALDRASAVAWDAMVHAGYDRNLEAEGYVAVREEGRIDVLYVDGNEERTHTVSILEETGQPFVDIAKVPQPLDEPERSMWRARQLALAREFRACTPNYNTVVVESPLAERPGWIVYLIAATTDPNVRVMGGDHRIWISPELEITAAEPLSRGCPMFDDVPPGTIQSISNFGIPRPLETHVFDSILYDAEIGVFNEDGSWTIDRGVLSARDE